MSLQMVIALAWTIPGVAAIYWAGVKALACAGTSLSWPRKALGLLAISVFVFVSWPYSAYKHRPKLVRRLLAVYLALGFLVAGFALLVVQFDSVASNMVELAALSMGLPPTLAKCLLVVYLVLCWPYCIARLL